MASPAKVDLTVLRVVMAVLLLAAVVNGALSVERAFLGWWTAAGIHFALVLIIAAEYRFLLCPRVRRIKQTLRGRRIAELEKELGIS